MGLLSNLLKQTAVYWAPVSGQFDAHGRPVRETPVEISCRWEDTAERFINAQGEESTSRAKVFVNQDLAVSGYLLLGVLTDVLISDDAVLYPLRSEDDGSGREELGYSYSEKRLNWEAITNPISTFISFPTIIPSGSVVREAALYLAHAISVFPYVDTRIKIAALAFWGDVESYPVGDEIGSVETAFPAGPIGKVEGFEITDLIQQVVDHAGYTDRICLKISALNETDPLRSVVSFEGDVDFEGDGTKVPKLIVSSAFAPTSDPKQVGALEIRSFAKTPVLKGDKFIRQVYL